MRFVHPRLRLRHAWIPAAAAALTLVGCGGSEEGKSAKPVASTPPSGTPSATKEPETSDFRRTTIDLATGVATKPLVAPLDAKVEYEDGTQKPLVASFPEARPSVETPPKVAGLPSEDALLGKPLVINGQVIPFEEVKRQCCLGPIGVSEIETAKLGIYIEEEMQRRIAAGAKEEELKVGDAELDEFLAGIEEQIKAEYPEGGVTLEDLFVSIGADASKERMRISRVFEKLFMPDDPAQYPPLTVEAILKTPGGDAWIQQLKQDFEARRDAPPKRKDLEARAIEDAILQQIAEHLRTTSTVVTAPAPGVLYRVNGVDIKVEDIWRRIQPLITVMEVHAAKQWIVNSTLLKQALVAAGAWLTDAEADAAYHAFSDPYKDSIFSYERIALSVKQFPSIERFVEYRHIYESFKRMKQAEITPEVLKQQAEYRTNKIVGQVAVDADVILCAAQDLKTGRWKENGWVDAENRMRDVLKLLVEEQQPWEVMVETYSDFYDPPMSVSERSQEGMPERPVKGRFRGIQRNNMMPELGESEYGLFLNGSSITDFIFFEQEVGTLGTPMRGPLGWYLPRLIRRSKPPRQLTNDQEAMDVLILDDYLTGSLNRFTQELIKKNEVYGLELPGTTPK